MTSDAQQSDPLDATDAGVWSSIRTLILFIVAVIVAVVVGIYGTVFALVMFTGFGPPNTPDPAAERSAEARELREAGRYEEAIGAYEEALALGGDEAFAWMGIAECHQALGRKDEAYAAYDAALEDSLYWPAVDRLHCVAYFEGLDAAVAWFERDARLSRDTVRGNQILGTFLGAEGALDEAAIAHGDAYEIANREAGVRFDLNGALVNPAALERAGNALANDLHSAAEALAKIRCAQGLDDEAFLWATRGVVLAGRVKRTLRYYGPRAQQAGCADCRLVRARVLVERREFGAARVELAFVDFLSNRTNYTGWARQARVVRARIAELERSGDGPR